MPLTSLLAPTGSFELAKPAVKNLIGLHKCDRRFVQSPFKFCIPLQTLFMGWIHEINPSDVPGYAQSTFSTLDCHVHPRAGELNSLIYQRWYPCRFTLSAAPPKSQRVEKWGGARFNEEALSSIGPFPHVAWWRWTVKIGPRATQGELSQQRPAQRRAGAKPA